MLEIFHIARRFSATIRRRGDQYKLILIWLLILSLSGAPQAAPVRAAPNAEGLIIYRMKVFMPPEPLCAGKDYSIRVRISADQQYRGEDGAFHDLTSEGISGRRIEAFARDNTIAEVSPRSLITGWDIDNMGPGEVEFRLQAKKAGSTVLFLEAYIKEAAQSQQEPYFGPRQTIQVVNCKYKVKMHYQMRQSSHGAVGLIMGNMDTLVEGDGNAYQGTGTLHTDRTESMAPCSFVTAGFDSMTTIIGQTTGTPEDEQLELRMDFQPAQSSTTITCPIVGAQTTNTTEDPSNWLAENAAFPETGGAHSFPIDYAQWLGRLIITVEPVDANS